MRKEIDFPKKLTFIPLEIIENLIKVAFEEDIKYGDITSKLILKEEKKIKKARIFAKEDGVICGLDFVKKTFQFLDNNTSVITHKKDGDIVEKGEVIANIEGSSLTLLSGERTALNFLGFLSGISTKVRNYTKFIASSNTKLLDTRKTIPSMRIPQKYAVAVGGGYNHRYGLYDMVLIKENHIAVAGSIKEAVYRVKSSNPDVLVEIEINSLDQINEVLDTSAEIVMLDNMDNEKVKIAFELLKKEKYVEVSGNINKERLIELSKIGVDFVSMGELTHTVKPLDISMIIE